MIFKKESNFPYPVLAPFSNDYPDATFELNVSLKDLEEAQKYRFEIEYKLECSFLSSLIRDKQAKIYLVIESKDQKFFPLEDNSIDIDKSRISLDNRTQLQLYIISTRKIKFANNNDIDPFYDDYKHRITVDKYSTLAMSNIEAFDGELKKPFELFEWEHKEDLPSEFKVELQTETIKLLFRESDFHYLDLQHQYHSLNNHYVYIGLQYALLKFLTDEAEKGTDELIIEDMDIPENPLYKKLYDLLSIKKVKKLHFESIDSVINQITDNIIQRHSQKVREVMQNDS